MQILLRLPDQLEVFVRLNTLSFITAYQQAALSPPRSGRLSLSKKVK